MAKAKVKKVVDPKLKIIQTLKMLKSKPVVIKEDDFQKDLADRGLIRWSHPGWITTSKGLSYVKAGENSR